MNKIKSLLVLAIILLITGCTTNENPIQEEPTPIDVPSIFKLDVNGVERYNANALIYKTENDFLIKIGDSKFTFNKQGDFGYFYLNLDSQNVFNSFRPFCSNYFNFNLESIDEVNKRVKATYSGYLYKNKYDLNSEKKYVSGYIDCNYIVLIPAVSGLKNEAKINGNQWVRVDKELTVGNALGDNYRITETNFSKDEYKIWLNLNLVSGFGVGTYNFTNISTVNNVKISKFDVTTSTYIDYVTDGSLIVSQKEGSIISGSYNFIATNPNNTNDVLQVTDGSFKLVNKFF